MSTMTIPGHVSRIIGNKAIVTRGDTVDIYNLNHYRIPIRDESSLEKPGIPHPREIIKLYAMAEGKKTTFQAQGGFSISNEGYMGWTSYTVYHSGIQVYKAFRGANSKWEWRYSWSTDNLDLIEKFLSILGRDEGDH